MVGICSWKESLFISIKLFTVCLVNFSICKPFTVLWECDWLWRGSWIDIAVAHQRLASVSCVIALQKAICHSSLSGRYANSALFLDAKHFLQEWYLYICKVLSLAVFSSIPECLMNEVHSVPKWKRQVIYFAIVSSQYKKFSIFRIRHVSLLAFQLWNIYFGYC